MQLRYEGHIDRRERCYPVKYLALQTANSHLLYRARRADTGRSPYGCVIRPEMLISDGHDTQLIASLVAERPFDLA